MQQPAPDPHPNQKQPIQWRQEYLHLTVVLMTASWIAGWIALSLNWFVHISFSAALGLAAFHLLASVLATRWMIRRRITPGLQSVSVLLLMWLAAGLTLLAAPRFVTGYGSHDTLRLSALFYVDRHARVPGGPAILLWVLFLWWRGSAFGSAYLTIVRATFGMRLGILMLFWLFLMAGRSLRPDILGIVPLFFCCGLISSSLARADSLELDRAGRTSPFGRGWILSLTVLSMVLTTSGYVAALWLSGMQLEGTANILITLAKGALSLVFVIFSPLLFLMQVAYNALKPLMPEQMPGISLDTGSSSAPGDGSTLHMPWLTDLLTWLTNSLIILGLVFVAILLAAFVWFVIFSRSQREYDGEQRESLGTGEVIVGLRQAWRGGWQRLATAWGMLRELGLGRQLLTALTIRRIYSNMEKLAAARGYPRPLAQTPYEYRRALLQAFPALDRQIDRITEAYIAVRYGDIPEDPAEVEAVRAAWQQLRASPDPTTAQ